MDKVTVYLETSDIESVHDILIAAGCVDTKDEVEHLAETAFTKAFKIVAEEL